MKSLILSESNSVFGISVKRCNIRKVHGNIENIDPDGFDQNQESALLPLSPVLILNKWNEYYYIKSHVATGWVESSFIMIISKKQAKELFYPDSFYIITEPVVSLCGNQFFMSCKIPFEDNMLQIPYADGESLCFKNCPVKEGCHLGYLPFSRNAVLSQAIKFLGTPYDWGEKNGGLDCSALVMYSFACCGIELPRSSGEQAKVTFPVSAYSVEDIDLSTTGDIIHSPGHVMLSLGDRYILHASYTAKKVCISRL